MLAGAQKQEEKTGSGFTEALAAHAKKDVGNMSAFFSAVDLPDGSKIVGHLLGGSAAKSGAEKISKKTGVSAGKTSDILAAIAPLLMSLLGKESQTQQSNAGASSNAANGLMSTLLSNVDIGNLALGLLTNSNDAKTEEKPKGKKKTGKKPAASAKKDDSLLGSLSGILGKLLK